MLLPKLSCPVLTVLSEYSVPAAEEILMGETGLPVICRAASDQPVIAPGEDAEGQGDASLPGAWHLRSSYTPGPCPEHCQFAQAEGLLSARFQDVSRCPAQHRAAGAPGDS